MRQSVINPDGTLVERWGPEHLAQIFSFAERQGEMKGMSKKELKQFITEHDLVFRTWPEPEPEPAKPKKSPFHR